MNAETYAPIIGIGLSGIHGVDEYPICLASLRAGRSLYFEVFGQLDGSGLACLCYVKILDKPLGEPEVLNRVEFPDRISATKRCFEWWEAEQEHGTLTVEL